MFKQAFLKPGLQCSANNCCWRKEFSVSFPLDCQTRRAGWRDGWLECSVESVAASSSFTCVSCTKTEPNRFNPAAPARVKLIYSLRLSVRCRDNLSGMWGLTRSADPDPVTAVRPSSCRDLFTSAQRRLHPADEDASEPRLGDERRTEKLPSSCFVTQFWVSVRIINLTEIHLCFPLMKLTRAPDQVMEGGKQLVKTHGCPPLVSHPHTSLSGWTDQGSARMASLLCDGM